MKWIDQLVLLVVGLLRVEAAQNGAYSQESNLTAEYGVECFNWQGEHIPNGQVYVPYADAPCLLCWCENGLPGQCLTQTCQPPPCVLFERIEGECCRVKCLDTEGRPYNYTLQSGSSPVEADLVSSLQDCCVIGTAWYEQNGRDCPTYPITESAHLSSVSEICQSVIQICCLQERASEQCEIGLGQAKDRAPCKLFVDQIGQNTESMCCHCCELGLLAKDSQTACDVLDSFDQNCRASFRNCCEGRTLSTTNPTALTDSERNVCLTNGNKLCSHICIPIDGSYVCACQPGFMLHSDKQSCIQNVNDDPCVTNNPCDQQCVNDGTQIVCQCFDGYALHIDGRTCIDVDECAEQPNVCELAAICINTIGSFTCQRWRHGEPCPTGFAYNTIDEKCEDIDECIIERHTCSNTLACINTQGGYQCFEDTEEFTQIPFDTRQSPGNENNGLEYPEIIPNPSGTSSPTQHPDEFVAGVPITEPSNTRPKKNCGTGFAYNPITNTCEDVDECSTGQHRCTSRNQICRNSVGSHTCMCANGFEYNPRVFNCADVDECSKGTDTCAEGTSCKNTLGSYTCTDNRCDTGFVYNDLEHGCVDVDECGQSLDNCTISQICVNTRGSFRCVTKQCGQAHTLDLQSGQCRAVTCDSGYRPDPRGNCIDVNECHELTHNCGRHEQCKNTIGSYECIRVSRCSPGFRASGPGQRCQDIDECRERTHNCTSRMMQCLNQPGTYVCECAEGHQLNQNMWQCDDIDECLAYQGSVCATNSECRNTPGSYECHCKEGFQRSSHDNSCQDVDECMARNRCQHECRNTWGSYVCICRSGYELASDGRRCTDIDECSRSVGTASCEGQCRNTPGSYTCNCPRGYQQDGVRASCQDIDECTLGRHTCHGSDTICVNKPGHFTCQTITCPGGFLKAVRRYQNSDRERYTTRQQLAGDTRSRQKTTRSYQTSRSSYTRRTRTCRNRRCRRALFARTHSQSIPASQHPGDDSAVCQRMQCSHGDVACLMNKTKSIQWQFLTLPTKHHLSDPLVLLNVHAIGYKVFPNLSFQIIAGNEDGLFDVIKQTGSADRGSVRLVRPVAGPREYQLQLQMDNRNRLNYIISTHIAFVTIYVSPY